MAEPRNFQCEATGLPCIDPQCKKGRCLLEVESDLRAMASKRAVPTIPRKDLEKVARDWFYLAGKRPTETQIENAIRHPQVAAEAKRRAAVLAKWMGNNSN